MISTAGTAMSYESHPSYLPLEQFQVVTVIQLLTKPNSVSCALPLLSGIAPIAHELGHFHIALPAVLTISPSL